MDKKEINFCTNVFWQDFRYPKDSDELFQYNLLPHNHCYMNRMIHNIPDNIYFTPCYECQFHEDVPIDIQNKTEMCKVCILTYFRNMLI